MKTILNTDQINRLTARIPPRWTDDLSPAAAPCPDVRMTQPAESLPRNSARRPAPSEIAVWRPIGRLHNKERARYENPLISANSLFAPRGKKSGLVASPPPPPPPKKIPLDVCPRLR